MIKSLCKAGRAAEDFLAAAWKPILLGLVVLACAACAMSRIVKDPITGEDTLVTTGTDIIPGVTVGEDIVGAGAEAVESVNPGDVIEKVQSGDWLGLGALVAGVAALFIGGIAARKKLRRKPNA
jgi:hypothetical protein